MVVLCPHFRAWCLLSNILTEPISLTTSSRRFSASSCNKTTHDTTTSHNTTSEDCTVAILLTLVCCANLVALPPALGVLSKLDSSYKTCIYRKHNDVAKCRSCVRYVHVHEDKDTVFLPFLFPFEALPVSVRLQTQSACVASLSLRCSEETEHITVIILLQYIHVHDLYI